MYRNVKINKDENVYRYVVRGKKDRERESERDRKRQRCDRGIMDSVKNNQSSIRTHQASPSVSITPKSMIYRDTAYLKMRLLYESIL